LTAGVSIQHKAIRKLVPSLPRCGRGCRRARKSLPGCGELKGVVRCFPRDVTYLRRISGLLSMHLSIAASRCRAVIIVTARFVFKFIRGTSCFNLETLLLALIRSARSLSSGHESASAEYSYTHLIHSCIIEPCGPEPQFTSLKHDAFPGPALSVIAGAIKQS
jgi:hypothetical protein